MPFYQYIAIRLLFERLHHLEKIGSNAGFELSVIILDQHLAQGDQQTALALLSLERGSRCRKRNFSRSSRRCCSPVSAFRVSAVARALSTFASER